MRPRPPRLRLQWLTTPAIPQIHPLSLAQRSLLPIQHNFVDPGRQTQCRYIRSIQGKNPRFSRFNRDAKLPPVGATPAAAYQRKLDNDVLPLRTGVLATKKGMSSIYDPVSGERRCATILQMDRVQVVANKTVERHGYFAVCIGEGTRKPQNVGRAMMGVFAQSVVGDIIADEEAVKSKREARRLRLAAPRRKLWEQDDDLVIEDEDAAERKWRREQDPMLPSTPGLPPKRHIREFRVRDEKGLLPIGTMFTPDWFRVGQFVDTRSNTRGMGFAGVMKRWGMKGQDASHGVSLTHRTMGSAGGSQGSGSRVHPGKKMAGRMGNKRHTIQSLEILMVDSVNGLVLVGGPVSGPKGSLVMIQDALKKPWPEMEDAASAKASVEPSQAST